jgi:Flp pilus assembly pilin Flp
MTRLARILRRGFRRDQAGVTVVEVTVTMLLLAVIMMVAFDFLDRTTALTVRTDSHARTEDETQRVLRTVTQHLRSTDAITGTCTTAGYATTFDSCVRFEVPRSTTGFGGCARTEFVIGLVDSPDPAPADEKRLMYDRMEHSDANCTPGTLTGQRLLLDRVVNTPTTQPLFTYYGTDGNTVTSAAAVPKAVTVKVTLAVRYQTKAPALTMTNVAALRNNITR